MFHEEDPRTYAGWCRESRVYVGQTLVGSCLIWVWKRPSGTGSGGADKLLMMHCWHCLRNLWFLFTAVIGGTSAEGEQKEIMVADLNDDWQMLLLGDFHKSWSTYFVSMSCIFFLVSRSCNGLFWFPHYAWDEDVMYLVVIWNFLMYPHMVGWRMYVLSLLVLGRSFMIHMS